MKTLLGLASLVQVEIGHLGLQCLDFSKELVNAFVLACDSGLEVAFSHDHFLQLLIHFVNFSGN